LGFCFDDSGDGYWAFPGQSARRAAVVYEEQFKSATLWQAAYHMLTASMKGLVALSGLEACPTEFNS